MIAAVDQNVFVISFAIYTLLIVGVGLYSARYAKRSNEDYFLAGRSLGKWVAALSASASSESGWVTLGLVGQAFMHGVRAYWIVPGCLLGFVFNWFVLAPRMRRRAGDYGAVTLPDFFSLHFKERLPLLRLLTVAVILVAMVLYVAAQFAAAGKAFSAAFGSLDYTRGVLLGGTIVLVYTITGGFRAVCWTDFLQALLMAGVLVVFPIVLLVKGGGFGPILGELESVDPTLVRFMPDGSGLALIGFLLGSGALGINFGYPGQPHVLVRFMALKDPATARGAGFVAVAWGVLVLFGAVTVGLIARALTEAGAPWGQPLLASNEAAEQCLVLSAANLLPAVMAGVVLAAVLAAICSTADSQLVVAASAAANDVWARLFAKDKSGSHLLVDRLVVLGIGVAAVLLVFDEQVQVYKYVLSYGWAMMGASFGPQLILLLLWKRASYRGCIAGMLTGFIVAVSWEYWAGNTAGGVEVYNLPLAFVCALVVNAAVSMLAPDRSSGNAAASPCR